MTPQEVIDIFRATGALLEGHFVYTSGRHGRQFLQAARVLQYPSHTSRLCRAMAEKFKDDGIELVVGPATGGIMLAYDTARHLDCRCAYSEKDGQGGMAVKRGFAIKPATRVLVVEDIVTTGGSVKKTIDHLRDRGADVVGVSVLIDRSGGMASFDCIYRPLAELAMESYPADALPDDLRAAPAVEPDDIMV
jgi:orotate phosphoribosyltransferase